MRLRRVGLGLCVVWIGLASLDARAAEGDCDNVGSLSDGLSVQIGTINKSKPRATFVRNASEKKGCPSTKAVCRDKRYLIPGDLVLLTTDLGHGPFDCATFVTPKGDTHSGWIESTSVDTDVEPPVPLKGWLGKWTAGSEQNITITRAKRASDLRISGDATYGAEDPDRVKRGAVNIGQIAAELAPEAASLSFAMDGDKTVPVTRGGEGDCKVWMRRAGPYLVVDDNNACGGMNVTFRGIYRRK